MRRLTSDVMLTGGCLLWPRPSVLPALLVVGDVTWRVRAAGRPLLRVLSTYQKHALAS